MTRSKTPLEQLLAQHWSNDPQELLSLIEQRFGVRMEPQQLSAARDASSLATVLKGQVDHPGRLERLAERLLHS
jgi:hypothetical protein